MQPTRSTFIAALAAAALTGCGSESSDSDTLEGFADGCEVKTYPVALRVLADSNLANHFSMTGDATLLESYFERYQAQDDYRAQVSFDIEWMSLAELEAGAAAGTLDGDMICAATSLVDGLGTEDNSWNIYSLAYHFTEKPVIVRAAGSGWEMPAASTLTGEDASDATFTQLMNLGEFDGRVGLAADTCAEGRLANLALEQAGLYTPLEGEEYTGLGGGTYDDTIADLLVFYETAADVLAAVEAGEVELGFAAQAQLGDADVTTIYAPPKATLTYAGTYLDGCEEPGVVCDVFTFICQITG